MTCHDVPAEEFVRLLVERMPADVARTFVRAEEKGDPAYAWKKVQRLAETLPGFQAAQLNRMGPAWPTLILPDGMRALVFKPYAGDFWRWQSFVRGERGWTRRDITERLLLPAPRSIGIIGCGKKKKDTGDFSVPACELYTGQLFRAAYSHARRNHDYVFILSAFFGCIPPDMPVFTYDRTLGRGRETQEWAAWAASMLLSRGVDPNDEVVIYAGSKYANPFESAISGRVRNTYQPLEGLQVGERLRWFKQRQ